LLYEKLLGRDWKSPAPESIKSILIHSVEFSPDDTLLAIGSAFGIRLVDARSGELRRQIDAPFSSTEVTFTADGKRLARSGTPIKADGGDSEHTIPVYSTETGKELFALKTEANAIRFSANDKFLAVADSNYYEALSIWPVTGDVITSMTEPPVPYDRDDDNPYYQGKEAEEFANRWKPSWGEA